MNPTVMLIDDSATVRLQACRALEQAGFSIIEATDGADALTKLETSEGISLIVCDVNMPKVNGIEFVEKLAQRPGPQPPVIMLTTEGHPELIKRAKAAGAKGWMVKPFRPEILVAAARKIAAIAASPRP